MIATGITQYARAGRWLLVLSLAALLASCGYSEQRESRAQLSQAAQAMEDNPQQAQRLLQAVQGEALSEADYAYYVLLQVRVAGMNGTDIAPMERAVGEARDYFTSRNDAPRAAFGYFVQAKVHEAQDNTGKAQLCYLLADEWARKANYQIPDLLYSIIPYNLSSWCFRDGKYKESLLHLEKALEHAETENCSYVRKVYMLELKANNFHKLAIVDSAFCYYDKALAVADQHRDILSRNRILYNKYALLYVTKDYTLAEEMCKELLPVLIKSKDSLHTGLTHLVLTSIYANTNRIDLASVSISKANELLKDTKNDFRLSLYETLSLVEQKKGNAAKANSYRRQYNEYKAQLESKRRAEEAAIEAEAALKKEKGEQLVTGLAYTDIERIAFAEHRRMGWLTLGMLVLCIGGSYGLILLRSVLRSYGSEEDPIPEFCRAELLAYARRSASLSAIRKGADRICPSIDQVGRVAYMIDELVPPDDWSWRRLSPTASCSYAELVGMLRRDFPQLNEKELEICALLYTQRLKARQVADIVHVELPQFKEQRKSMKHKLREAGYTSRGIRKYVKRRIE